MQGNVEEKYTITEPLIIQETIQDEKVEEDGEHEEHDSYSLLLFQDEFKKAIRKNRRTKERKEIEEYFEKSKEAREQMNARVAKSFEDGTASKIRKSKEEKSR